MKGIFIMRVKVYETPEKLYGAAAETVAKLIRAEKSRGSEQDNREIKVCLSADKANLGLLKELATEDVSWKNVSIYPSWEFLNENSTGEISRRKKIDDVLISRLTSFDSNAGGKAFSGAYSEKTVDELNSHVGSRGGFDVFCGEIMPYGALLANLPLTNCFDCREAYRNSEDLLGSAVVTVSPFGILKSRHAVLTASGIQAASWVAYILQSEFSAKCPAAVFKEHRDFILLLDKQAASLVPQCYL